MAEILLLPVYTKVICIFTVILLFFGAAVDISAATDATSGVIAVVTDGVDPLTGVCAGTNRDDIINNTNNYDTQDAREILTDLSRLINAVLRGSFNTSSVLVLVEIGCDDKADVAIQNILDIMAVRTVIGVITITRGGVAEIIVGILPRLRIPVVEMASADVITRTSSGPYHYVVPHYTYWEMQNTLFTARVFNWTALMVAGTGQDDEASHVRRNLFKHLTFENGACSLPAYVKSDVPIVIFQPGSNVNLSIAPGEYRTMLIVGELDLLSLNIVHLANGSEQFVLYLYPVMTGWSRVVEAIKDSCNMTYFNSNMLADTQGKNQSICTDLNFLKFLPFGIKSYVNTFISSVSFLLDMSDNFIDTFSCSDSNMSLQCLLSENIQPMLDKNSNLLYGKRIIYRIQYFSNYNDSLTDDFTSMADGSFTLLVPKYMPSAIMKKACGDNCNKCMKCFPSKFSETKIITSGDGDMFIVGFFPVHLSTLQGFCDKPNLAGYFAAIMFIETIKSHFSWRNMSRIQGVVFDSCGSPEEVISVIHSLETCTFYFREEKNSIQIPRSFSQASIVGYVDGMNSFDLASISSDRMLLTLRDLGYSTARDLKVTYVENVLRSLLKIGWTVINFIVTDQEQFRTMGQLFKASPLSRSFCFVNDIIIHSELTHRSDDLDKTVASLDNVSAYLLLTSPEDTVQILNRFQANVANMTTKVSFVLSPWNGHVFDKDNISTYVDVVIKFRPAVKHTSNSSLQAIINTLHSVPSPWNQEFRNISNITSSSHIDLALVQQSTEKLLKSLEKIYHDGSKTSSRDNLIFSDMDMITVYASRNYETDITSVTTELVEKAFDGPVYNVCRSWCPVCYGCGVKETAQKTSLYIDGDLLIIGLFPLHKPGLDAFTCGAVQDDIQKLIEIQSFMFAVDSFKMRYPNLLPGLKVGGQILSTCSDSATTLKVLGDYQTCTLNFPASETRHHEDLIFSEYKNRQSRYYGNPSRNLAYIIDAGDKNTDNIKQVLEQSKLRNTIFVDINKNASTFSTTEKESIQMPLSTVQMLTVLGWDKIIIMHELLQFEREAEAIKTESHKSSICVLAEISFQRFNFSNSLTDLEAYRGMPVVLLSSREMAEIVFDSLNTYKNSYFWIIPVLHESWGESLGNVGYFPLGSIVIDMKSNRNEQFNSFVKNVTADADALSGMSPWFKDLWRLRFSCYFSTDSVRDPRATSECPTTDPVSDIRKISPGVGNIMKSVDAMLHILHADYTEKCPRRSGICDKFADVINNKRLSLTRDVTFQYQGEQLDFKFQGQSLSTLSFFSYQKTGIVQIGSYFKSILSLNVTKLRLYTAHGLEINKIPRIVCAINCQCLDISLGNDSNLEKKQARLYTTRGEFIDDLWTIIVLTIGGFGAFLSLTFAAYVVYKVSRRALGKRYVGLGLTLLSSFTLLFLTVLPFVFSPSETICGLKYLLPGLSYSLCFAVILVKLMSLQNYKLIGLGGEVSWVNQFLTAFFIVGVQIAIGVQWWLKSQPNMQSLPDGTGVQLYACNFSRQDFAIYHVYVMLLILICCLYAIGVRNEKKNMGEAKLLLACSWTCLAIWVTWFLCLFLLDRKWSDIIICAGILSCATAGLLIIFVPKIRMVSRLKYDVAQKVNFRNGHSVDKDFLYERPYSLPGTLTSTFSSVKMNYPKTFSNFDADVNY